MVEFDEPREGRRYRITQHRIVIQGADPEQRIVIWVGEVLDVITACVEHIKKFGMKDELGREINTESFLKSLAE